MSTLNTEVFLASRFEEFEELRTEIKKKFANSPISRNSKIELIDLNDGNVSHRPPLVECLSQVRRSELLILLLGETYGSLAPNATKSFTHLEYEEAIRDGSNTRVLVYCIGSNYTKNGIHYSQNETLAEWQREIDKNHTWIAIAPIEPASSTAEKIYNQTISHYFELRNESLLQENLPLDDFPEDIADFLSNEEEDVDKLEQRYAKKNGIELTDETENSSDIIELLRHPNRIACREHREEAMTAIELRAYGIAIQHLSRALSLRPLDLASNYWLAKLYLCMGKKNKSREIIELSERAIQIAQREATPYRVAICYLMAADASAMANKHGEALQYAKKSVDAAPNYSKSHIGLAKHYLSQHQAYKNESLEEIKIAYRIFPPSIREIMVTPDFKIILPSIYELLREEKTKYRRHLEKIIQTEHKIAELLKSSLVQAPSSFGNSLTIKQIQDIGKNHIRQIWASVSALVSSANALKLDSSKTSEKLADKLSSERTSFAIAKSQLEREVDRDIEKPSYFAPLNHPLSFLIGIATIVFALYFLSPSLIQITVGFGLIAIIRWAIWRKNINQLKTQLTQKRRSAVDALSIKLSAIEIEIEKHNNAIEQAINDAQQAMEIFENLILELPQKILPFKPLSIATAGDYAVTSKYQLEQLEKSGKSIEWSSTSSFQWAKESLEKKGATLVYIEGIKEKTLIASGKKGYLKPEVG